MSIRAIRKTSAFLVTILLSVVLCINASVSQSKADEGKHSLWKIHSKSNTVYLLGSVHMLKPEDYPLDKSIENAYERSSQLFFEVDLDSVDKEKLQQLTIAKGTYSGGLTLKDGLSKQTYKSAQKRLVDLGLKIEQFERFKPWILAMTLAMSELQRLGFDQGRGIDKYFSERAKKDGKKVDGLETAEYQLGLFGDMPADTQEAMLLQTMNDLDRMQKQFDAVVRAWKTGDANTLDTFLLKSFKDHPGVYKALITDRNKNWLPKIESLIGRKENVMVVVGVAHLVGSDGIVAALAQKGYQVEQQ